MFFQALSKILIAVLALNLSLGVVVAKANENKEEKKAEGGGKVGEGGGEGEGSESQKKQANEPNELQSKVQALQAKVKSKEESINKLIEEKNRTKDPDKVAEIIKQMVSEHKEMSKMIEEYEQNRSLLRYRYPEKGFSGGRSYERMEVKPLDQMENQMSVEAKLNRNLKTLRSQYGEPVEAQNQKKKKPGQKRENEAPSLTEPLVIQK
jgi:hypothetical protein